jgi:hypothetical protein
MKGDKFWMIKLIKWSKAFLKKIKPSFVNHEFILKFSFNIFLKII